MTSVSVVVPARDAAGTIVGCLRSTRRALSRLPCAQLIVVENGSSDETASILRSEHHIDLRFETSRSSYAARNLGISATRSDVVAFIDADCEPAATWAARGVAALDVTGSHMAAGRVIIQVRDRTSPWQLYDCSHHMDNESAVRRGAAYTANLFVRREVIDSMGPFDPLAQSGEDVAWTTRASRSGFTLTYVSDAIVVHPARDARALLSKAWRTGSSAGRAGSARCPNLPDGVVATLFLLRSVLPPNPITFMRRLRRDDRRPGPLLITQTFAVSYLLGVTRGAGLVASMLRPARGRGVPARTGPAAAS